MARDSRVTGYSKPTLNGIDINEPPIISTVLSMSASTAMGAALSFNKFGFEGLISCSLAGGVIVLSSASYISNPTYAIVLGVTAALSQYLMLFFS